MPPLKLGIIGYGGFGRFLHQAWSQMEAVRVTAVADTDAGRDPGGVRFYRRWQELVADPDLDLVSIVTPPGTHAEIACAAMEAGKHVLIEKPLATSREDAYHIRAVQDRTGRLATVDYMLRFNPIVETLHAWSRSRCFGRLRRVVVENYAQDEALPRGHWFWDAAQSGGILVEHAVHFIDVVNGCTRALPARVDGVSVRRNPEQEDRMMLTVVYEDGLVASQYHAFSRPGFFEHTSMRFVFDLAQVEVEGWIPLSGRVRALVADETEAALRQLPGLAVAERQALAAVADTSRPEGWGAVDAAPADGTRRQLRSGGEAYPAEALVTGTFALAASKADAYAASLRALLADLIAAVRDPGHLPRVTLAHGIASLEVALKATAAAHAQ